MNNYHTKENGAGEKLYGMPLEDILTPEQLLDLQKQRQDREHNKKTVSRKRRQKQSFYIKFIEWIKTVFFSERYRYAVAILAGIILVLIILKPVIPFIAPKSCVTEAVEKTFSRIDKETGNIVEKIFGFDILNEKNIDAVINGTVLEDSYGKLPGVGAEASVNISKKQKEAVADISITKNGEDVISATGYLTDHEAGINFPRFFGEYWVSSVSDFGKRWNGSGFQKTLYANEINENSDISFSNVFCENEIFADTSEKQLRKIVKNIMSSSKARYAGKKTVQVNGKDVKAKSFVFSFEPEQLQTELTELFDVVVQDSMMQKRLDVSLYSDMLKKIENLSLRFANSISLDENINLYFSEYKGLIVGMEAEADYIENLHDSKLKLSVRLGNTKNITESVAATVNVSDVNGGYRLDFSTEGNRSARSKVFTDKTVVDIVSDNYAKKFSSVVEIDLKDGNIKGDVFRKDGEYGYNVEYQGDFINNKNVYFNLESVKADITGQDGTRTLSGNMSINVWNNHNPKKHTSGSKKHVLDMEKEEAEAYLTHITDADVFKTAYKTLEDIFGK